VASDERREKSAEMGRIPPHPGVFVRVASKELAGYGTWKCGRRMEDGSATGIRRRRAEEERGWLVSNKWLTIIATPLFFISVDSKRF
jgi:hypothetical protein